MKKNSVLSFKTWLPHIVAIAVFMGITLAYMYPVLSGEKMVQSDILSHKGSAKEIYDYREQYGEEPLWTNSMFGGMPSFMISTSYPSNYTQYIQKIITFGTENPVRHIFLLMLGFYVLMLALNVNPWLGIVGSIGFAFSSYFFVALEAGHTNKIASVAYIPAVIAGVLVGYRKNIFLGFALTALALTLELYAKHVQITYYLLLFVVIIGIGELISAIKENKLPHFAKATVVLIFAAVLAIVPNWSYLDTARTHSKETIRGGSSELTAKAKETDGGLDYEYATGWSYGKMETFTLLIPNYYGGASGGELSESSATYQALKDRGVATKQAKDYIKSMPLYWGDQRFTSGPVYVGAAICFLFLLGMFVVKDSLKWALLAATFLSLFLAWGKHSILVFDFFFYYVPYFNKFRTPSMALILAETTMPIIGILAIREIVSGKVNKSELMKALKISLLTVGGLVLIFGVFGSFFMDGVGPNDQQYEANNQGWLISAIQQDRLKMVRMDALRSLFFIIAAAAAIFAFATDKLKKSHFIAGLAVIILADLWFVDKRIVVVEL